MKSRKLLPAVGLSLFLTLGLGKSLVQAEETGQTPPGISAGSCDARLYVPQTEPFSAEIKGTRIEGQAAFIRIAKTRNWDRKTEGGDRFHLYPVYERSLAESLDADPRECSYTKIARRILSCSLYTETQAKCAEFCDFHVQWMDCR